MAESCGVTGTMDRDARHERPKLRRVWAFAARRPGIVVQRARVTAAGILCPTRADERGARWRDAGLTPADRRWSSRAMHTCTWPPRTRRHSPATLDQEASYDGTQQAAPDSPDASR